jgi:hypothetical protein
VQLIVEFALLIEGSRPKGFALLALLCWLCFAGFALLALLCWLCFAGEDGDRVLLTAAYVMCGQGGEGRGGSQQVRVFSLP